MWIRPVRKLALSLLLSGALLACVAPKTSTLLTPLYARGHMSLIEDMRGDLCSGDAAYTLAHFGWTLTNSDMRPYEGIPVHKLASHAIISATQFKTLQAQFIRIETQYPEGMEVGGFPASEVHNIFEWCN